MKLICMVLGLALIAVAAIYFLMPADQLPSFFPGHANSLHRIRFKHGLAAGGVGVLLIAVGWWLGRR